METMLKQRHFKRMISNKITINKWRKRLNLVRQAKKMGVEHGFEIVNILSKITGKL